MEGLARAGNGTAEFVKEGERMQPKVRIVLLSVLAYLHMWMVGGYIDDNYNIHKQPLGIFINEYTAEVIWYRS